METIISAVISAAAAITACLISNHKNNNKMLSLIEYRLQQLEKKQDKYNNVISRTYELEKSEEVFDEKLKVVNHRIKDLEDRTGQ